MKICKKICLAEWTDEPGLDYIDIPWPKIHQLVGHKEIAWIQSRNKLECQLIFETFPDYNSFEERCRLYVEFYDLKVRTEYALKFAK